MEEKDSKNSKFNEVNEMNYYKEKYPSLPKKTESLKTILYKD